jgi:hypothetical protein
MAEIIVPFSVAAADVNLLDTVPVEIGAFGGSVEIVKVPVRLELWRAAGTAYAPVGVRTDSVYPIAYTAADYRAGLRGDDRGVWEESGSYLLVREVDSGDRPTRVIFRVPIRGFLTGTDGVGVVAFPLGGDAYFGGDKVLQIVSTSGLSGGTGVLSGRVFYAEFPTK